MTTRHTRGDDIVDDGDGDDDDVDGCLCVWLQQGRCRCSKQCDPEMRSKQFIVRDL